MLTHAAAKAAGARAARLRLSEIYAFGFAQGLLKAKGLSGNDYGNSGSPRGNL